MEPGEKLDLIKAIKGRFDGMPPADQYLHVDQFTSNTVPTLADFMNWSDGQSEEGWLNHVLPELSDDELRDLHAYTVGTAPTLDKKQIPWQQDKFRLFISHIAAEKALAMQLSTQLERYGVHGFVAHEHIDPGLEWQGVIRAALLTCDALVAVLHPGFKKSNWTDQEVGFVLGQNKFAIALRAGLDPYGFLGSVQGLAAPPTLCPPDEDLRAAASTLAKDLVQVIAAEARTQPALTAGLVYALCNSYSFDMSNSIIDALRQAAPLTQDQYELLRKAQASNTQVAGAYNVAPFLDGYTAKYGDQDNDDLF